VSGTKITCDLPLTGVPSGVYDLFVKQNGCIFDLPAALSVAAAQFVNGGFEEPAAALNCGPPPQIVGGMPTGWVADVGLFRDGNAPVPPTCPSPAGGNYGSMSSSATGTLRAWQTLKVQPGQSYTFSGYFSGSADCTILLLDGNAEGTVLNSTPVFTGGDGGAWKQGSVSANAVSEIMTVMWRIDNATPSTPGGHADGLEFKSNCHAIWADADSDGDVDMLDFAAWQRCVTNPSATASSGEAYCSCFDRVAPFNQIDDADFYSFQYCASGPGIAWTDCNP
jgi:hypothetical protein